MNKKDLDALVAEYDEQYRIMIDKAYAFAEKHHHGVKRKSGEEYITHPLAVACTLAKMHADVETIEAGLLHDTIEDCPGVTYQTIYDNFGPVVAKLVNGVTKIRKEESPSREENKAANKRKIIESLLDDVRIVIIKLADRLHNMSTLEFHSSAKQKEIAEETMDFYVPIADLLGCHDIKNQLEDLCFMYLMPEEYALISEKKRLMDITRKIDLDKAENDVKRTLESNGICAIVRRKDKNMYGLYKRKRMYKTSDSFHDAISLKIIVGEQMNNSDINMCYLVRDLLINLYPVEKDKSKDFIRAPKANLYQGLHETYLLPDKKELQLQIVTPKMYEVNMYGISADWSLNSSNVDRNSALEMQNTVEKLQFYKSLKYLVDANLSNTEFSEVVNSDIAPKETIEVWSNIAGKYIRLPKGSTAIDLAYKICEECGDYDLAYYLVAAKSDKVSIPINLPLYNRAVIELYADKSQDLSGRDLSNYCMTNLAKIKIKENRKNDI